jgi:D-alanyl-D-alanine carboxypeptidase/D-alanyl-D-alanine-endopeptidase (penicillin-binding protein 4)
MSMKKTPLRYFLLASLCLQCLLVPMGSVEAKTDKKTASKTEKSKPALAKTYYHNKQQKQDLPETVKKLLKKYKISADNISVYIRDLNSKTALIEHNADKLRTPASTMKLLTTYAGLKELGPNYSWRTEIWLRGELKQGVLHGDLIIKGFGDPFLVVEKFWKLVKTLRDKGLKDIQGDIIIDNSYFQQAVYDPAAFDGKPFRVYNAQSSAVMFNFQATRFLFKPVLNDKENIEKVIKTKKTDLKKVRLKKSKRKKNKNKSMGKVDVIPFPIIDDFKFENKVKLVKGKCKRSHYRPKFFKNKKGLLVIKGNFSAKCKQRFILRAVSKPEQHVFNAFREVWLDLKGTLKGNLKIGRLSKGDERFHVYSSPTLGEQIRLINKWSNNVMTRQLLLTLGAKKFGAPGTLDKGKRAVLSILSDSDIDIKGIEVENGSGLSRKAKISARQMASLLEKAYRDAYMPEFLASLSLPGIDGTLVNRFRKDDIRGRSHLKTGTLDYVTAIAGYMLNRDGKRLVIVVQHNGKKAGAGRGAKIQDALLRWSFEQ